jgi:LysR family transcriptional regulator for metE and metH
LVASGRGVACLPNWALTEYLANELLTALRMSESGLWGRLYAAIRSDQREVPFMSEFLSTASSTCFETLSGIKRIAKVGQSLVD